MTSSSHPAIGWISGQARGFWQATCLALVPVGSGRRQEGEGGSGEQGWGHWVYTPALGRGQSE